jgi:TolA-binding protein
MFYAGEAESRLGKSDRAIAFYNQLLQNRNFAQSSLRPDAMFSLGLSYEEASQRKLAMETYEGFIAAYPKHILATNTKVRLAELALQSEQIDKAVKLFASIVDSPDLQKMAIADYVMYRYAFALAKSGQFANSSDVYKKLAEQFPKSQYAANASLAIGQTLMRDKKYDEASRSLERLLGAKDERAVEAAHWLCQIAMLKDRPADAIPIAREALQWATKWDPKTINPPTASMVTWLRMDLADGLYTTADGKAEARKLYEQIAVEAPDSPICPRATYNAAFAALQAGDHAEAQRWSEAFAKRFPNDELALDVAYVRAESLLQLSQFESSATAFEQLVRSASNHPSLIAWELRAATAKYLAGNFDGAVNAAPKPST